MNLAYFFRISLMLMSFCWVLVVPAQAQDTLEEAMADPIVADFVGNSFGTQHAEAPAPTEQFGQLVGIWLAQQEILTPDGWKKEPNALWTWKYILGGYATQDLWYQKKDALADYLDISGRDYMLSGIRIFDPKSNEWKIGWASNGGGQTPGQDGGHFTARMEDGELIMSGPPFISEQGTSYQRVVFYQIQENNFKWRSDFSVDDGISWNTIMKVSAIRLR